jgi:hypothetical protein
VKVYVLVSGLYDGYDIDGVYLREDAVNTACEKQRRVEQERQPDVWSRRCFQVEEHEVNE